MTRSKILELPVQVLANRHLGVIVHPQTGQILDLVNRASGHSQLVYLYPRVGTEGAGGIRLVRRPFLYEQASPQAREGENVFFTGWKHRVVRAGRTLRMLLDRPIDVHTGTEYERQVAIEPQVEICVSRDQPWVDIRLQLTNLERDWPLQPFEMCFYLLPGQGGRHGAAGTSRATIGTHVLAGEHRFGPESFEGKYRLLEVPAVGVVDAETGEWVMVESDRPATFVNGRTMGGPGAVIVAPSLPGSIGHTPPLHHVHFRVTLGQGGETALAKVLPIPTPVPAVKSGGIRSARKRLAGGRGPANPLAEACLEAARGIEQTDHAGSEIRVQRWLDRARATWQRAKAVESSIDAFYPPGTVEKMMALDRSLWDLAALRRAYLQPWGPVRPAGSSDPLSQEARSALSGIVWAAWAAFRTGDLDLAQALKSLLLRFSEAALRLGCTDTVSISAAQTAAAMVRACDILSHTRLRWEEEETVTFHAGLLSLGEWVWQFMHGWQVEEHQTEGGWTVNRGQKGYCHLANWKTMECYGLSSVAKLLPGYANSPLWMDYTETIYRAWFDRGLTREGFFEHESSVGYHGWALRFLYWMGWILEHSGRKGLSYVSPETGQSIASMARFTARLQSPRPRVVLGFGNGARELPAPQMANLAKFFHDRALAAAAIRAGWRSDADMREWGFVTEPLPLPMPRPKAMPPRSFCLRDSGLAVFRTGDLRLAVNFGVYKSGHCHRVKLETELWAGDTCLSPETCPYENEPGASLYQGFLDPWGRSAFAKNAVTLDQEAQNPLGGGRWVSWKASGGRVRGKFSAPTYAHLRHERAIAARGNEITITDRLVGRGCKGFQEATWRMNFLDRPRIDRSGGKAIVRTGEWTVQAECLGRHRFHLARPPSRHVKGFQLCASLPSRSGVTFRVRLNVQRTG
ncbi:MAG: heparinase II/III family protein [Planctomycetes bacterium]|nr:heparinase II/III family protein [Planctomycetota bacterium]